MTNQLIPYNEVEQFGKAMVASNYFSDAKSISQAVVKIQAGAELGLPPFASMTGIHIIKGKPVLGANVLATLVKNDPRYDYKVKVMSDEIVTISFYENGAMVGESSFSVDDAKKAGTQNMGKFPRNMLFARAMSNGAKWYTPGIFGGMPVYTPEDFDIPVDEDGDIIEGAVVQQEPEPTPTPEKYTDSFLQYCVDNIERYENIFAVRNALKKQYPEETGDKKEMMVRFERLKVYAEKRDMEDAAELLEEAEQDDLFGQATSDGAYNEA